MKFEIDATLIAQFIDALKDPSFATGLAINGAICVAGWAVITYIKLSMA